MRRFCIYKRHDQAVYYTQIKNPETGKYLTARSTGTRPLFFHIFMHLNDNNDGEARIEFSFS